jgi:hypothetical protein
MDALIERIKRAQQARDNNKESATPGAAPSRGSPSAEILPPTHPKLAQHRRGNDGKRTTRSTGGTTTTLARRLVSIPALLPVLTFASLGEMLAFIGRRIRR